MQTTAAANAAALRRTLCHVVNAHLANLPNQGPLLYTEWPIVLGLVLEMHNYTGTWSARTIAETVAQARASWCNLDAACNRYRENMGYYTPSARATYARREWRACWRQARDFAHQARAQQE